MVNPDGTTKNITFDRKNITDFDENGHKHIYTIDGLDRITHVYEFMTDAHAGNEIYLTRYEYDTNDNLVLITDSQGKDLPIVSF